MHGLYAHVTSDKLMKC